MNTVYKFFFLFLAMATLLITSDSFHLTAHTRLQKSSKLNTAVPSSVSTLYMSDTDDVPKMQDPVMEIISPGSDSNANAIPGKYHMHQTSNLISFVHVNESFFMLIPKQ